MTDARIISDFAKCGTMHHLSRQFHNLRYEAKSYVIGEIQNGADPQKAIKDARRIFKNLGVGIPLIIEDVARTVNQ